MWVRLHHERRRPNAVAEKANAFHERAVGDARRREDDVVAGSQILGPVDPLEVRDAHRAAPLFVLGRVDDETGVDLAAKTPHGRRREHALWRAPNPHHRVHAAADHGRGDAGRQVTVSDQANSRAGCANLLDQRSWRGRSRTMTTRSSIRRPSDCAIALRLKRTGASRSTTSRELGPTTSFSM